MIPSTRTLGEVRVPRLDRQHAAAEMRAHCRWSKSQMRRFYGTLIHHETLKVGRSVVDAIMQAGR